MLNTAEHVQQQNGLERIFEIDVFQGNNLTFIGPSSKITTIVHLLSALVKMRWHAKNHKCVTHQIRRLG